MVIWLLIISQVENVPRKIIRCDCSVHDSVITLGIIWRRVEAAELVSEMSAVLNYVPDLHRKMLITHFLNTGGRSNAASVLIRTNLFTAPHYSLFSWLH